MTYRYYYRRRTGGPGLLAGAAVAAVVAAAAASGHGHHHRGTPSVDTMARLPAAHMAGGYAPRAWAVAFLHADGKRATPCNRAFVEAWETAEGTYASLRNPLDSTEPMPGSYPVNSVGVQHYKSLRQGLEATVITIRNGLYPAIEYAMAAGNDARAAADAVSSSPWGTQRFQVSC